MRKSFALLAFMALVSPVYASDPIPSNRETDWTFTGVPGGIPNRTTICATFSPGATAAQINAAIGSCNNGVVFLNAGTYTAASLGGRINVTTSNVTLRGAGADKTILTGTVQFLLGNGNNNTLGTAITGGGTQGSNTITVSSTANLSSGTMIEVDRADDPALVVGPQGGNGRNVTQVNMITAVNGNVLTLRNPWDYDFSTGSPQVKWYFSPITQLSGVEDLKIDHQYAQASGFNFDIQYCDSCWVKGVESAHAYGYHFIAPGGTLNLELRNNFVHDGTTGPDNSGFNMYGDYRYGAHSSAKIENNIFNNDFPAIEINNSTSGNFIGYNYVYGSNGGGSGSVTWTLDDDHAPFNIMNLYEGNIAEMAGADAYFGGSGYATWNRNYLRGFNPNFNAKGDALWLDRLNYFENVVGNVLGSTSQVPTAYSGCNSPAIYRLGYPNLGNCDLTPFDGFTPPGGYPDPKVISTLLRWGNYDYFNNATQWNCAEIPSGIGCPSSQTVPASYYYASTPSWWPLNIPFPPIGPDVISGNGDASGHVNKIPAQVCWESGLNTGGAFNEANCYQPVQGAPQITSPLTASGTVGQAFNYQITATNSPTSYGASPLPGGLSVNATSGAITGTPTAAGQTTTVISATNGSGTGQANLVITVGSGGGGTLIGTNTVGSTLEIVADQTAIASMATAIATGTVNTLSVNYGSSSGNTTCVAGIYSDNAGSPGTLLGQASAACTPHSHGWANLTLSPGVPVTQGTKYWVAAMGSAPTGQSAYFHFTSNKCNSALSAVTNLTSLPSTWSTGSVVAACAISAYGH